jgi:hypothetical protein
MSDETKYKAVGDTLYQIPPNTQFHIEALYAFLSQDEQGREGVCAMIDPFGGSFPMVVARLDHVEQLKPIAAKMQKDVGRKIKLVKFTTREELMPEMKQ